MTLYIKSIKSPVLSIRQGGKPGFFPVNLKIHIYVFF